MLRFACFITGDDYQMVKTDTPASRKKVVTLGTIIFLPVSMWFINILLLVSGVLKGSQLSALIAALVAAWLIFLIERSIIMSTGSRVVVFTRVIIGFFIAVLGSLALDEVIFKDDIDKQMTVNKEILIQQALQQVDTLSEKTLSMQEEQVRLKHEIWNQSLENAGKEADGTSGSGVKGVHAITRLKMQIAEQTEQDYGRAKADLDTLNKVIESKKTTAMNSINASFNNSALLERIKAMFDLIGSDHWMCFVYCIVTAVLFAFEFIVVLMKIFLPKTNYEYKLEVIEEIGRKRLMKIMQHDVNHYEANSQFPQYRAAQNDVVKLSGTSVFN